MQKTLNRIGISLASFALATTSVAEGQTLEGNPRVTFSGVGKKIIVKLPVERECWVLGGNEESMFGLTADENWQYGILFTDQRSKPVRELKVLVSLRGSLFEKTTTEWYLDFESRGTTNRKDYVYLSKVSKPKLEELIGNAFITFTAVYQTEVGAGQIGLAHKIEFSQEALDELGRCVRSFK